MNARLLGRLLLSSVFVACAACRSDDEPSAETPLQVEVVAMPSAAASTVDVASDGADFLVTFAAPSGNGFGVRVAADESVLDTQPALLTSAPLCWPRERLAGSAPPSTEG